QQELLWRNWLARLTVNQEVGGSSPPRSDSFFFIFAQLMRFSCDKVQNTLLVLSGC
ncbi:hypothetical protein K501DRAFT_169884, partial [Backusella circina FSU 941]